MSEDSITTRIEKQDWLDTASGAVQKAVTSVYQAGGETGQQVKDVLHGTWMGHPLHAAVTDVPVGAWAARGTDPVFRSKTEASFTVLQPTRNQSSKRAFATAK
jgi:hypothetical protein